MTTETPGHQTPKQYLETHSITRRLKILGVTGEQLETIRFRGTNKGFPFDQWSFTWSMPIPLEAVPHLKAYCALKWLVLENPPYSRDKEDAWQLISETAAAPTLAIGEKTRRAQSARARKPRGKITDEGTTLGQMIEHLAVNPQYQSQRAKELWPRLYSLFDEEGLDPREIVDPKNTEKGTYEYDFNGKRRTITFRRFESIVSKARVKKKTQ